MKSWILGGVSALSALLLVTGRPVAAVEPTTVRVALMDMSAIASDRRPEGAVPAPNPGGNGTIPMGAGMMAVRIDDPTIKAGPVRFDVTNWSRGLSHEFLVMKLNGPSEQLPYDKQQAKVDEDKVKVLVDTDEIAPSKSRVVDVTLAPGTYMLICNLPSHYASGMSAELTVTP